MKNTLAEQVLARMVAEYEQRMAVGSVECADVEAGLQMWWETLREAKAAVGIRAIPRWRWR